MHDVMEDNEDGGFSEDNEDGGCSDGFEWLTRQSGVSRRYM